MSESRIDRIKKMEAILDEANASLDELAASVSRYVSLQKKIRKLENYYTDGQWRKDYEADEAGKLQKDLKRGVLSEDAVYDLLERNKEIYKLFKKLTIK
ncbi:MAG: DUF4298 domain-containing protein [Lachnospiraceae bacterium]|nr:DUF4298 domain-containing protein [Lachnospiraceae bacterium]